MPSPFDANRLAKSLKSGMDFELPDREAVRKLHASRNRAKNFSRILHKAQVYLAYVKLMTQESIEKPFKHFDFDLARAVLEQLVEVFDALPIGPLKETIISKIDEKSPGVIEKSPGVYMLFVGEKLHYVGKADKNLSGRLQEHLSTLNSRKNIDITKVGFKGITVHRNWTPLTHEESLIKHYKGTGLCEWNTKGLGNHDPGRERENTETNAFDKDYPIDESFVVPKIEARPYPALELLLAIKNSAPYVFRFQTDQPKGSWMKGSEKYNSLTVNVPSTGLTMKELLQLVVKEFGGKWRATFFPGHVILYEEEKTRVYRHAKLSIPEPSDIKSPELGGG